MIDVAEGPEGKQLIFSGMEAIASQLRSGRDSSSSPNSKQELQSYSGSSTLKPNQVGETNLYGVPIVSLVIDGQERLCLAQISNTLLKNYSYNEIHNRRVALGITCVQCTPVQLEILRRAGAMPISSRRCGMITKREAERLCKSFLGEHRPPKLPENFAFDVTHECAWGSRGSFIPARYNSSRAKCIKCSYCNMYFSPNKFIFHSHRTPESKYTQPDAANFNSWRRHLKLSDKCASDDLCHAWEDVKAMFNGGTRKRTLSLSGSAAGKSHGRTNLSLGNGVRSYPVIPVPSKGFGMLQKIAPPLFPHPYGFSTFGLCQKKDDNIGEQTKSNFYISAFRPVVKDAESIAKLYGNREAYSGPRPGYLSPDFMSESSSYRSVSPDVDTADEPEVDVESNRFPDDDEPTTLSVKDQQNAIIVPQETQKNVDALQEKPTAEEPSRIPFVDKVIEEERHNEKPTENNPSYEVYPQEREKHLSNVKNPSIMGPTPTYLCNVETNDQDKEENHSAAEDLDAGPPFQDQGNASQSSLASLDRGEDAVNMEVSGTQLIDKDLESMGKDELQKLLVEQMDLRKKLEREFQNLKDNFQDQMKRELSYREEMVQQLQIVRDTLCNELDQERKARYAIQQKLKEAHDALHHFSCKMLTPRHCTGNCSFKPPLLPQ
nr:PREDICTED: SKI family transcriptional corepressor 1 [Latimeria chalumnae]|eukprot:XP_006001855.1 PREDICTED: SKI family transcriptional corepressor 1 [Latimeria chalumnae]